MDDYDYDAADPALQAALEPLFTFLSSVLPSPLYSLVSALLTHSLTFLAALLKFANMIYRSAADGSAWDAQKVLPPLITLLMAYLALLSFYRTTSWMFRTAFWFAKWGGIIAALAAGAGYFMANANLNGDGDGVGAFGGGATGLLSLLGSALLGVLNEDPANSARAKARTKTKTRTRTAQKERPKAWEGWDKHRDWQYDADAAARADAARANEGVQEAVQKVAGFVQEALAQGWWETVKSAVDSSGLVGATGSGSGADGEQQQGAKQKQKQKQDAKGRGGSR